MADRLPPIPEQYELDAWQERAKDDAALDAVLWALCRVAYAFLAIAGLWVALRVLGVM